MKEIQQLIQSEARLLDQVKLDEWLDLFTQDARYWIPMDENADPLKDSSIIYDDIPRLKMRVDQIIRQNRVAQQPASQTLRMISNIDIIHSENAETAEATFAMLLMEMRSGDWRQRGLGQLNHYPAHCSASFEKEGGQWKISKKIIRLLNRHQPIFGLSFLM
ncbi:nuclear transport factor 2 family protein [Pseudomonas putida]|uniref:aromatic-ring-hydroxylating dioxygenase subunit beta n=1 Tax=Pseudomonas putida TaxID=303 RepID=UPI00226D95DA|nr:aromatic-ring-hydroxylating dioxygenase subunit beta [Pseudomonas putida]WAB99753.1 nuclear transport factor 2 family protein [Pseudomonas putida]